MNKVKHRRYKTFAGPVLYGHTKMQEPGEEDTFLEKLVYVTSKVESGGYYGSVFMADGTGITAGLCQHVSVLPKSMMWGDLWGLIAFIDSFFPIAYYDLGELLMDLEWTFQPDGVLRHYDTNAEVSTHLFRNMVTPLDGTVPAPIDGQPATHSSKWLTSKQWCLAIHQIFAQPSTHRPQLIYECRHFQRMVERTHFRGVLKGKMVGHFAFPMGVTHDRPFEDPHVELAMLVFLSFAVNAPKWAYLAFEKALQDHAVDGKVPTSSHVPKKSELFARALIKELEQVGGSKWDDDRRYGRYQRTRGVLLTMFDTDVVDRVMPEDLPEQ